MGIIRMPSLPAPEDPPLLNSEWDKIRQAVNAIDNDQVPDPQSRLDESGRPLYVPNPYNVVISVMMLKEGWDVRNVKVIVPLRPCDSRTLTEQTLGRGLRKMHSPVIEEDGSAKDWRPTGVTTVKEYVRERKRPAAEVFVPLVYRPADLGEVDFFEVLVDVAGKRTKAWMFGSVARRAHLRDVRSAGPTRQCGDVG